MSLREKLFLACYEGEGGEGGEGAGGNAGAGAGGNPAAGGAGEGGDPNIKDQNHLNSVLKREKEKMRAEREKQAKQLEQLQATLKLTDEQNGQLTAQIEELRTANMTVEEQARRSKEKADKEWGDKLKVAEGSAQHWQGNYTNLKIGYEITAAASKYGVIPAQLKFAEAYLTPKTRLVEDKDEDGKAKGTFTAMVSLPSKDKAGKAITLDLTVPDAFKTMKEQPEEYGDLFEAHTKGGLGGSSGTAGKKPNVAKMSTAEYIEARNKNRNLVYGS